MPHLQVVSSSRSANIAGKETCFKIWLVCLYFFKTVEVDLAVIIICVYKLCLAFSLKSSWLL